jgi:Mor transcription activator family
MVLQEWPLQRPMREVPTLAGRRHNREAIRRLFQGYVDNFDSEAGEKIINVIVDMLGRVRLTIPKSSHNGNPAISLPVVRSNQEILWSLYLRLSDEFGEASGKAIMQKLLFELRDMRLTFPNFEDLAREERNRKIRAEFRGNYSETALRWGMSPAAVRKIVMDES